MSNFRFWLVSIGLQQVSKSLRAFNDCSVKYVRLFEDEGYLKIKDLENLSFEELEDMGIKKLGHIKRICLALRKLKVALDAGNFDSISYFSSIEIN